MIIDRTVHRNGVVQSFVYTCRTKESSLFTAKANRKHPKNPIPIDFGSEVHLRSNIHNFYLIPNSDLSKFVLRSDSVEGNVLMVQDFWLDGEMFCKYREIEVQFPPRQNGKHQLVLINKQPELNSRGEYVLSFHGKKTLPSQKNTVLIQKGVSNANDFYALRRVSTNTFEADLYQTLEPILVFAISLGCLLTGVD
jgi:hypothetical protein